MNKPSGTVKRLFVSYTNRPVRDMHVYSHSIIRGSAVHCKVSQYITGLLDASVASVRTVPMHRFVRS